MRIQVKELENLFFQAAKKYVSEDEAWYFAKEVVETDIRKPSHKKYDEHILNDIISWDNTSPKIKKLQDLPGHTKYDFGGLGPSLKIKEIHDELERKAKAIGIAMVSITNSAGMHKMHLWVQGLAKRGLLAITSWNGGPDAVIPINGTKGLLGTNPLAYGFPSDKDNTVVDMATSQIPFFKIVDAEKTGAALPNNTAVDSSGNITTDPKEALDGEIANLLPMGANYKGYCINYLLEVMTSALIGAKPSSEMHDGYVETEHGGFIIAIAIEKSTSKEAYDSSITSLNKEIRSQKPKQGKKVIVPGDTNQQRLAQVADAVDVADALVEQLISLAQ